MEEDLKFTETNQVVYSLREWEYFEETLEEAYKLREKLRKYILEEETRSVLLSSHITTDLEQIADYIIFIHQGKIVFNLPMTSITSLEL